MLPMDMVDLSTATALVTGASSGIGAATARTLAAEGADLALCARSEDDLRALADDLRDRHDAAVLVAPADVRRDAEIVAAVETTVDRFGGLDAVVANAGIGRGSDVATMSDEAYEAMQETNVDGTFYLTRATLPHLVVASGNLVVVGSFAGQYPRSYNPVYAATKWWVRGFAHSVAAQVGDEGVGVSVVNPSEVRTRFGEEEGEAFEERFAPGEVTEPEEVAEAIAFAAGQEGSTVQELDLYRRDKLTSL